ncbi:unnamed protein product [Malus baccata var. baccata]
MDKLLIRPLIAVLISLLIPARSYQRKSLEPSGAIAGFAVMSIHIAVGYRYGSLLLVFFFTSSKLTKVGEDKKRRRNWVQVLSNSGIASILVLVLWAKSGLQEKCLDSDDSFLVPSLVGGVIGHYACSNGDTWYSELGPVQKGTNGRVTKPGLLAAAGSVLGLTFVVFGFLTTKCAYDVALKQSLVIPISTLAALVVSVIDSLVGATLQFSGFCTVRKKVRCWPKVKKISGLNFLDNNAVNVVSILLTTILTSIACNHVF